MLLSSTITSSASSSKIQFFISTLVLWILTSFRTADDIIVVDF